MNYLLTPFDHHFDLGFGAVANSFKYAGDAVLSPQSDSPSLNKHLPTSYLHRHAIELYLKSGIIIFHKKFQLSYGEEPFDGEPRVQIGVKWKRMFEVHGLQDLYRYLCVLVSDRAVYLSEHTRLEDWTFPPELNDWIAQIDAIDWSSTFWRYPVTKHSNQDQNKSINKVGDWASMVTGIAERSKPLKAFLVVNENEEVVQAFQHDDELAQSMSDSLQKTVDFFYSCHAAMRMELTGGW
jgi:hypothetical protein